MYTFKKETLLTPLSDLSDLDAKSYIDINMVLLVYFI